MPDIGSASNVGRHQGTARARAPYVGKLVGPDRHLADAAQSFCVESHAYREGRCPVIERLSLWRCPRRATNVESGTAVVAYA